MGQPSWLQSVSQDTRPAPRLFAWSFSNLDRPHPDGLTYSNRHVFPAGANGRIHVLGVGNVGILFATSLSQLPERPPITLVVHRRELLEQWHHSPGLHITRNGATECLMDFDVEWWTEEEPTLGPKRQVADGSMIQNLLVSTKASAALPQVDRVRRYLDKTSTVAFAQNGMCKLWPPYGDAYNILRYPKDNSPSWIACVTTHGVTTQGRFRSEHASVADLKVGPVLLNQRNRSWSYLLEQLHKAPHLHGKIVSKKELWVLQLEKLVVNAVINPITALLGCKNGKLFEEADGPLMDIMEMLLREASAVLQALVQHPSTGTILGISTDLGDLIDRFSTRRLRQMLLEVGYKVRDNKSSMLQDFGAGKDTEIDDFNGWFVDTASFLGGKTATTTHEALLRLVKKGDGVDEETLKAYFLN